MPLDLNDLVRAKVFSPSNLYGEIPKYGYYMDGSSNHAFSKNGARVGGFPLAATDIALGLGFMPLPEAQTQAIASTQMYLSNQVRVLQFDADAPVAPAIYQRVVSEPAHEGKFQDAAGFWFEVQPNELGRYLVAWFGDDVDGIRLAQVASKQLQGTPGFNYVMPTTGGTLITATDENVELWFEYSTFTLTQGCVALALITGTYSDTLSVTNIAGNILTVPGGVGSLVKGDMLKMADGLTPHWWNQGVTRNGTYGAQRAGEFGVVKTVNPTIAVTGATNNGSGAIRIVLATAHYATSGVSFTFASVGGVPNANGTSVVTVINSTTLDLVGSTFAGAYTSGGTAQAVVPITVALAGAPEWSSDRIPEYMREIMRTDVTNVTDNGSGACRVALGHPHFGTTGLNFTGENIGGVPGANGTFPVTIIDASTIDLVGSVFSGTYTSGGTVRKSLTYSTHATAAFQVGKLRDNVCRIKISQILCAASVTTHAARIIQASARKNIDWKVDYIEKSAGVIFSPVSCWGGTIEYYAASTGVTNTKYILTNGGSSNIVCKIRGSGTTRHTIDGGAASTADGITGLAASGASAYCSIYVEGWNIGSTEAAHATHAGTYRWTWYSPKSLQTTGNVAVRGVGHTVVDSRSTGGGNPSDADDSEDTGPEGGGALATFCQFAIGIVSAAASPVGTKIRLAVDGRAGRGPNLATGLRVRIGGCTDASAANTNGYWYMTLISHGFIGSQAVTYIDLDGSTFVSGTGAGDGVCDAGLDGADDFTVVNATVENSSMRFASAMTNGGKMTIKGGVYNGTNPDAGIISIGRELFVRELSLGFSGSPTDRIFRSSAFAELLDIDGLTINAAGTLPHLFDQSIRTQSTRVLMRKVRIYNYGGAVASLYRNVGTGGTGLPPAGSRFGDISVYGELTTLISGLSMAASIAAIIPYLDGPIYANGEMIAAPIPKPLSRQAVGWGYTNASNNAPQSTSKSTTVTQNAFQGYITMNAALLAGGGRVNFQFTNSFIQSEDTLLINHEATGLIGDYYVAGACGNGLADIGVRNLTAGDLSEAVVLRYKIIKGTNS